MSILRISKFLLKTIITWPFQEQLLANINQEMITVQGISSFSMTMFQIIS